jgi:hypothetical protein
MGGNNENAHEYPPTALDLPDDCLVNAGCLYFFLFKPQLAICSNNRS